MLKMNDNKIIILEFDWLFTQVCTDARITYYHEENDSYIRKNLRDVERMRALLTSLYYRQYPLVIVAKQKSSASQLLHGKELIKKYLDLGYGRNRLFLQEPDIYTYPADEEDGIETCLRQVITNYNSKSAKPIDLSKSIDTRRLLVAGTSMNMLHLVNTFHQIRFIPVDLAGIQHLQDIADLIYFGHQYLDHDFDSVNVYNRLHQDFNRRYLEDTSTERQFVHALQLREAPIMVDVEVPFNLIQMLNELMALSVAERADNFPALLDSTERQVIENFRHNFREIQSADDSPDVIARKQNLFTSILRQIRTAFLSFQMSDFTNATLNKLITQLEKQRDQAFDQWQNLVNARLTREERIDRRRRNIFSQLVVTRDEAVSELTTELYPRATPLSKACIKGNVIQVKKIFAENQSIFNIFQSSGVFFDKIDDAIGFAPIHIACRFGHRELFNYLVRQNVNLELPDTAGYFPLHHAVIGRQQQLVTSLIAKGAHVNSRGGIGRTPLHAAVFWHSTLEIFNILLQAGANINLLGNSEEPLTPLQLATEKGQTLFVTELLLLPQLDVRKGVTVAQDKTPRCIVNAIINGFKDIVRVFMDLGYIATPIEQENLLERARKFKHEAENIYGFFREYHLPFPVINPINPGTNRHAILCSPQLGATIPLTASSLTDAPSFNPS